MGRPRFPPILPILSLRLRTKAIQSAAEAAHSKTYASALATTAFSFSSPVRATLKASCFQ